MARVRLSQNRTHSIHNEAEADTPAEYTAIGNIPCGAKTGREQADRSILYRPTFGAVE
jgi:hypothetical protein